MVAVIYYNYSEIWYYSHAYPEGKRAHTHLKILKFAGDLPHYSGKEELLSSLDASIIDWKSLPLFSLAKSTNITCWDCSVIYKKQPQCVQLQLLLATLYLYGCNITFFCRAHPSIKFTWRKKGLSLLHERLPHKKVALIRKIHKTYSESFFCKSTFFAFSVCLYFTAFSVCLYFSAFSVFPRVYHLSFFVCVLSVISLSFEVQLAMKPQFFS